MNANIKELQYMSDLIETASFETIKCIFNCLEIVSLKPMYIQLCLNKHRILTSILALTANHSTFLNVNVPSEMWHNIYSYMMPDVDEITVKYLFNAARFNYAKVTSDFHYFALKRLCEKDET
jgi:hypothetical protein